MHHGNHGGHGHHRHHGHGGMGLWFFAMLPGAGLVMVLLGAFILGGWGMILFPMLFAISALALGVRPAAAHKHKHHRH